LVPRKTPSVFPVEEGSRKRHVAVSPVLAGVGATEVGSELGV